MPKNPLLAIVLLAGLSLTACGSDSGDSNASGADSGIDKNTATAQCGILGNLLNGDSAITAENYEEVQDTLKSLAEDGVGAVAPTAEYVLDEIDGVEHSEAEGTAILDEFKDFCKDYTID